MTWHRADATSLGVVPSCVPESFGDPIRDGFSKVVGGGGGCLRPGEPLTTPNFAEG